MRRDSKLSNMIKESNLRGDATYKSGTIPRSTTSYPKLSNAARRDGLFVSKIPPQPPFKLEPVLATSECRSTISFPVLRIATTGFLYTLTWGKLLALSSVIFGGIYQPLSFQQKPMYPLHLRLSISYHHDTSLDPLF